MALRIGPQRTGLGTNASQRSRTTTGWPVCTSSGPFHARSDSINWPIWVPAKRASREPWFCFRSSRELRSSSRQVAGTTTCADGPASISPPDHVWGDDDHLHNESVQESVSLARQSANQLPRRSGGGKCVAEHCSGCSACTVSPRYAVTAAENLQLTDSAVQCTNLPTLADAALAIRQGGTPSCLRASVCYFQHDCPSRVEHAWQYANP